MGLALGLTQPTTPHEPPALPGDPAALLPQALPGFERTVTGLNGSVGGASVARTFLTMGPPPRRALVVVVTRAGNSVLAASVLAGARGSGSTPLAAPPGAAETNGRMITFRRGVWVATLTMSVPNDPLLVPAAVAVAEAPLMPRPTAADLGVVTPTAPGSTAVAALVGASAVVVALAFGVGLVVVRRRLVQPPVPAVIPSSLPALPVVPALPVDTALAADTALPAERWSTSRTADELGVSPNVVRRLVGSGHLTPTREGRAYRFDSDQVRTLAAYRRPRSRPQRLRG